MGFNIMDLMNGATRAAVEGVDNYEAITLTTVICLSVGTVNMMLSRLRMTELLLVSVTP